MVDCDYCGKDFSGKKERLEHELAEHREEMSGHEEGEKKSELNKLEQKTKTNRHNRREKMKLGGIAAVLGLMLIGGGFLAAQNLGATGAATNATLGIGEPVHWHADYQITVCGENRVPQNGPILAHTHGQETFHLEGVRQDREQATLGWVMDQLGTQFTEEGIYGRTTCDGEPAELTVKANGEELENPYDYVIRDGDSIVIRFA